MLTEKQCCMCKLVLPASEFYPHRRMKSGLQSNCRKCARKWHHARPDYVRRKNAEWKRKNPTYGRDYQRKAVGVSPEDIIVARQRQDNKCAGCLRPFDGSIKECADHNHKTGKFRGLLCNDCNLAIGRVGDDLAILSRLVEYLKSEAEAY